MKQSEAWIVQFQSDFATAELLYHRNEEIFYCQAIAKYQQTVEKAVKAMVAAIIELGVTINPISRSHDPSNEIDALRRKKKDIDSASISLLVNYFDEKRRRQIKDLCSLAPHWPVSGMSYDRNTEYPFNTAVGDWTAPTAPGAFTKVEVEGAREIAWVLKQKSIRFVSGVRRSKS